MFDLLSSLFNMGGGAGTAATPTPTKNLNLFAGLGQGGAGTQGMGNPLEALMKSLSMSSGAQPPMSSPMPQSPQGMPPQPSTQPGMPAGAPMGTTNDSLRKAMLMQYLMGGGQDEQPQMSMGPPARPDLPPMGGNPQAGGMINSAPLNSMNYPMPPKRKFLGQGSY